jgi:hypothetical protein
MSSPSPVFRPELCHKRMLKDEWEQMRPPLPRGPPARLGRHNVRYRRLKIPGNTGEKAHSATKWRFCGVRSGHDVGEVFTNRTNAAGGAEQFARSCVQR